MSSKLTPELRGVLFSEGIRTWLRAVCRRRTRSAADMEDLEQQVVMQALQHVEKGFFEQAPIKSREAQVKFLLGKLVLKQQPTRLELDDERMLKEPDPRPGVDESLAQSRQAAGVRDAIGRLKNPMHRLILTFDLSAEDVSLAHLVALQGYEAGGHLVLARDAREAFDLFEVHLRPPPQVGADEVLGEILGSGLPFGSLDETDRKRVANTKVQAPRSRSREALRKLLGERP